ncbi:hypothetical protein BJX96DRAFT_148978 [Aspergillus floccosus]
MGTCRNWFPPVEATIFNPKSSQELPLFFARFFHTFTWWRLGCFTHLRMDAFQSEGRLVGSIALTLYYSFFWCDQSTGKASHSVITEMEVRHGELVEEWGYDWN